MTLKNVRNRYENMQQEYSEDTSQPQTIIQTQVYNTTTDSKVDSSR